jgi:hypothetical protein
MNPYILGGAVIAFLLAVGGSYFFGRHDGRQIERAAQARVESVAAKVRDEVAGKVAQQISAIEVKHVTIRQAVERQILEKPVYRDCAHDAGAFGLLNSALRNEAGEPVPADPGGVPAATSPR